MSEDSPSNNNKQIKSTEVNSPVADFPIIIIESPPTPTQILYTSQISASTSPVLTSVSSNSALSDISMDLDSEREKSTLLSIEKITKKESSENIKREEISPVSTPKSTTSINTRSTSLWCHQCRRKNFVTYCCTSLHCTKKYCEKCARNHYNEIVDNVNTWICFTCRGVCSCSKCRRIRSLKRNENEDDSSDSVQQSCNNNSEWDSKKKRKISSQVIPGYFHESPPQNLLHKAQEQLQRTQEKLEIAQQQISDLTTQVAKYRTLFSLFESQLAKFKSDI